MTAHPRTKLPSRRRTKGVLLAGFVVVTTAVLIRGGIRIGGDTATFVGEGNRLFSGDPLEIPELSASYLGYVVLVGLSHAVGAGNAGVIAVQLALAVGGGAALFELGRRATGTPLGGVVASASLLWNPEFALWHSFIYSDSIYISGSLIAVWLTVRADESRTAAAYLIAALSTLAVSTVRPTAWVLIPILITYCFARRTSNRRQAWALGSVVVLGFVAMILLLPFTGARISAAEPLDKLTDGVVIPGYPPGWVEMPEAEGTSAVGYVIEHPVATGRLALTRVWTSLSHTRPFFSASHNLVTAVTLVPLYVLAVYGWWQKRSEPVVRLAVTLIAVHLGIIAISFASYDGRFLLHFLSYVGVLAACGVDNLWNKVRAFRRPHAHETAVASGPG